MNYDIKPIWDSTLAIVFTLGTITPNNPLNGMVYYGVKETAGAPANLANRYVPYAIVEATDGNYENQGTTLSPNFVAIAGGSGITSINGDTTAAQTFVGAGGTTVNTVGGVTTITGGGSSSLITRKTTLSSAQVLALFTTPIVVVPAQGAGTVVNVISVQGRLNYNSATYTGSADLAIIDTTTSNSLFEDKALLLASTSTEVAQIPANSGGSNAIFTTANGSVSVTVKGANPTAGNSTMDIYVTYSVTTL